MNTEFLNQRLQCSRTDKLECMYIVQQLLDIAFYAREHSLVDLDKYIRQDKMRFADPYLKKAVSCLVDIKDADLIEQILDNYILSGNYIGQQFLRAIVIEQTILAIHRKVDVDKIFSFIIPSLFGLECEGNILQLYRSYIQKHGYSLSKEDDAYFNDDTLYIEQS